MSVHPLYNANTFADLAAVVQRTEVKLSFFGRRYICVKGTEETVDFSILVAKIMYVFVEDQHFSELERIDVRKITKKINQFYLISDDQVRKSNIITRVAILIRRILSAILYRWSSPSQIRRFWESYEPDGFSLPQCKVYKFYTQKQAKESFGAVPELWDIAFDCYIDDRDTKRAVWFHKRKNLSKPRIYEVSVRDNSLWRNDE